jgi:predicted secreted protein
MWHQIVICIVEGQRVECNVDSSKIKASSTSLSMISFFKNSNQQNQQMKKKPQTENQQKKHQQTANNQQSANFLTFIFQNQIHKINKFSTC